VRNVINVINGKYYSVVFSYVWIQNNKSFSCTLRKIVFNGNVAAFLGIFDKKNRCGCNFGFYRYFADFFSFIRKPRFSLERVLVS
jgi:hypothetical protein